jgi:transcriptional antiterminator NusG
MMSESTETERPKIDFAVGEMVKIKDGAFENFDGKIEEIDPDHGKLRLSVSIFGRSTPVEVGYWQVERES